MQSCPAKMFYVENKGCKKTCGTTNCYFKNTFLHVIHNFNIFYNKNNHNPCTLDKPISTAPTIPSRFTITPTTPIPNPRHPCDGKPDGNHPITNQCSSVYMKCTNGKETYEVSIRIHLLTNDKEIIELLFSIFFRNARMLNSL